MQLILRDWEGRRLLEGVPGQPLIRTEDDVIGVLEECFGKDVGCLLLYPENLTEGFFDLSSGEAGAILQKLRNYRIRLAVVRTPKMQLSHRFSEMMAEENRGPYFRIFDVAQSARDWLISL